jgi:16S rRNA (adenine1518-N6/adenine1519-N6)-dimethyltransferase
MIRPKKHLGQHFLRDEQIAANIAGLVTDRPQLMLEIGPGTGVLSKYFLKVPELDAWFMDLDKESVDYLIRQYPEKKERFLHDDFLSTNLDHFPPRNELIEVPSKVPFTVIGNFPYNISSQILFRVLDFKDRIPLVVGMFQKEVAERITAPPGSKTYGILSVLISAWYEAEYLFTVSESVFYPPPKVKSAVIRLKRNNVNHLDCDEVLFKRLVKTAFNQRRKTLRNALRPLPGAEKLSGHPFMEKRAEQLSVADFIALAREIPTFA